MKSFQTIFLALTCLLAATSAQGGGSSPDPYEPIEAKAVIDACRSRSTSGDRAKSLETRQEEAADIGVCYAAAILRLMEPMFDPGVFPREEAEHLLREMYNPASAFYAHVLTYHRKCPCGDDAEIAFRLAAQKPFESILEGIGEVREEYSR